MMGEVMFRPPVDPQQLACYAESVLPTGRWVNRPGISLFTTAYFHLPSEARSEAGDAGFSVEHLYANEG